MSANEKKEIGWFDISLHNEAAEDPIMQIHPKRLLSYHFHGDAIRNVPGATVLASSDLTPWQAFRIGTKAYGFQYHAEASRSSLAEMCRDNRSYLASNGIDADALIADSETRLPDFEFHSAAMLERWLDMFSSALD